ncbi:helix-turn-helix domain-containing protein [Ruania halotolerans]|uniref:helix-turn-helix domain-containing protein n=1 Tax=Ruania halotolerans TaxID=2897773 RepID=UPI001E44CA1C|nr:AraC family transcriptional regulator [Ruania halotolerans]UFU06439.1 AraC family transcriptional regulator [Ruania halotolerans]
MVEDADRWSAYLNVNRTLRDSGLSCRGAGEQYVAPMPKLRARRLSTHALVFVTAGGGQYFDDTRHGGIPVPAPSVIWLTPGARHAYGPRQEAWQEHWVLFEGTMTRVLEGADHWTSTEAVRSADPASLTGLTEAFDRLRRTLDVPTPRSQLVAATVVAQLIGIALDATSRGPRQRAASVTGALLESATLPLSVAERAAELGLTVDALHAAAREASGLSPHEFIIQARITRAQHLLAETTNDVGAIGTQVGYDDPAYFSRLFRRRVGMSPSEFRRQESPRQP